jgi:hypothetical protein
MRLEGFEPPRACAHVSLKHARRPVPPQPRGERKCSVRSSLPAARTYVRLCGTGRTERRMERARQSRRSPWLHCRTVTYTPLSSRGLGRRILSPETRVRIPVAVPLRSPAQAGFFFAQAPAPAETLSPFCPEICIGTPPPALLSFSPRRGSASCFTDGAAPRPLRLFRTSFETSAFTRLQKRRALHAKRLLLVRRESLLGPTRRRPRSSDSGGRGCALRGSLPDAASAWRGGQPSLGGLTDEFPALCWSVRRIPTHGRLAPCGN